MVWSHCVERTLCMMNTRERRWNWVVKIKKMIISTYCQDVKVYSCCFRTADRTEASFTFDSKRQTWWEVGCLSCIHRCVAVIVVRRVHDRYRVLIPKETIENLMQKSNNDHLFEEKKKRRNASVSRQMEGEEIETVSDGRQIRKCWSNVVIYPARLD